MTLPGQQDFAYINLWSVWRSSCASSGWKLLGKRQPDWYCTLPNIDDIYYKPKIVSCIDGFIKEKQFSMNEMSSIFLMRVHTGVRSCYDEGKRVAETLMFDYHRQHGIGNPSPPPYFAFPMLDDFSALYFGLYLISLSLSLWLMAFSQKSG